MKRLVVLLIAVSFAVSPVAAQEQQPQTDNPLLQFGNFVNDLAQNASETVGGIGGQVVDGLNERIGDVAKGLDRASSNIGGGNNNTPDDLGEADKRSDNGKDNGNFPF